MIDAISQLAMFAPEIPAAVQAAAPVAADAAQAITPSEQTLIDLGHIAGMVIAAFWALLLLLSDAFSGPGTRTFQRRLALVGAAFAFVAVVTQYGSLEYDAGVRVFAGFLVVDHFSLLVDLAIIAIAGAVMAFSGDYARTHRFEFGEQESLVFMAAFGMMILSHSANTLALFLGIETMSIAVYVLVGARWNQRQSSEAAFKYFVMGAFSSGILLMGLALLYGGTGTTDLRELQLQIASAFTDWGRVQPHVHTLAPDDFKALVAELGPVAAEKLQASRAATAAMGIAPAMLVIPGVFLTLGALLFKVSAVPFHMWTPDAYDGAPTPVTGFMAAGIKIAGFAALLKLYVGTLNTHRFVEAPYGWTSVVAVIALLTMTIGNLAAVRQNNVKRLLAYSSVAHVGYLLIGVVAAASFYGSGKSPGLFKAVDQATWAQETGDATVASMLFYLGGYAIATLGAFACVAWLGSDKKEANAAHEWSGLASRHPAMALGMTICLLSLMGLPPTAGFVGKLFVFKAGLENSNTLLQVLVVVALLNAVVGAYYYLRLIVNMYFRAPLATPITPMRGYGAPIVVAAAAAATLAMGIGADAGMRRCELAASGFTQPAGTEARAEWVDKLRARWEAADEAAAAAADSGAADNGAAGDLPAKGPVAGAADVQSASAGAR